MCEIGAIMEKHEQYAMGWIRLNEGHSTHQDLVEMVQYKMGIGRLIREHLKRCESCQAEDERKSEAILGAV